MALSALDDHSHEPTETELHDVLGGGVAHWEKLAAAIDKAHAPVAHHWHSAGKAYGWTLRLIRRKRTILYLIPQHGHFLAGLVFGERAVAAVRASDVPRTVIEALDAARPYAEGRGIRLPVRSTDDVATVLKLAAIKMAH